MIALTDKCHHRRRERAGRGGAHSL